MGETGLPQVDVDVDEPGSDHQPRRIDNPAGGSRGKVADRGDDAIPNENIGQTVGPA
jgi:hypothetical protein